ncbi:MAG: hypothetical protein K9M96_14805 [Deltaproteobacteria bacterium]|nr:hypothetical protein [Deltaproteobacteria bacterium]
MVPQTFILKSLVIQNGIMLFALGVVLVFLIWSLVTKRRKHLVAALVWVGMVLWFFNSEFFGFSAVTVDAEGIGLNYGVLSFRNTRLSIDAPWRIKTGFSDIRKLKRVYSLSIAGRESMKVRGEEGEALLASIGKAIDRARERGR